VTICADPTKLRCEGHLFPTIDDVARYALELGELLSSEFRLPVTVFLGVGLHVECEDTELGEDVHRRVADIQASTDGEWIRLAFGGGA
jgi:hypothetical protein